MPKIRLDVVKDGKTIYSAPHEIVDAESFGVACASVWRQVRQSQLDQLTSIGALMEHLDDNVLEELNKATILVERTGADDGA